MGFREINPEDLSFNVFDLIGRQWTLIGSKKDGKDNLMTASWGGLGVMWGKPSAFIFVRHSRYTHELLEGAGGFSLNFYGDGYQKQKGICGSKSGRDIDKMKECGFTARYEGDVPYTGEAEMVLVCKKNGKAPIPAQSILDGGIIAQHYADGDFHDLYIGEIVKVLVKG